MMKSSNRITRLVDDLAAHWTEPVLEILKPAGTDRISVPREIETWRTLSAALQTELGGLRTFRWAANVAFDAVREQVFGRAISVLARKHSLLLTSHEVDERVRVSTRNRRSTAAERELFGELLGEPVPRTAFKNRRQTDFVPQVQLAAAVG